MSRPVKDLHRSLLFIFHPFCRFRLIIVVTLRGGVCALTTQVVSTVSEQFMPGRRGIIKKKSSFQKCKIEICFFPFYCDFCFIIYSPIHGSGQQCCYDSTGSLVLTGDSVGGSTPDRAHDWGSPPYIKPPRVPGYSHWLYDVMSFYYCCLWSPHCHIYLKRRPSSGCQNYRPPRAGETTLQSSHMSLFNS